MKIYGQIKMFGKYVKKKQLCFCPGEGAHLHKIGCQCHCLMSPLGGAHRSIARPVENHCFQQEDASSSQTL